MGVCDRADAQVMGYASSIGSERFIRSLFAVSAANNASRCRDMIPAVPEPTDHLRASETTAQEIARRLATGAAVILPTETVYGLAILPDVPSGRERVFELKGRPKELNLPVVIGATDQLSSLGVDFNETARLLAERFWPGPLTIVMGFAPDRERPAWLGGREEVAIRFPDHELLREVARAAGPILVTSANAHGTGAKSVASEAAASLRGKVDLVVDGGTLTSTPSTIVNTRWSPPRIERVGAVTVAEIEEIVGETRGE